MANSDARGLGTGFGRCDLHKSIAAIGGLLTLPVLQANTLRLEAIAHLALVHRLGLRLSPHDACNGRRSPTLQNASRWFKLIGAHMGHLEDPAEDVFVTRVIFNGANYRIVEGLHEANGHQWSTESDTAERVSLVQIDWRAYGSSRRSSRGCLCDARDLQWRKLPHCGRSS